MYRPSPGDLAPFELQNRYLSRHYRENGGDTRNTLELTASIGEGGSYLRVLTFIFSYLQTAKYNTQCPSQYVPIPPNQSQQVRIPRSTVYVTV